MEEEFKTVDDVQKWLSEERNVPTPVATSVATTLFASGYVYPSTLLNIHWGDLLLLNLSPPHRSMLFNKLQASLPERSGLGVTKESNDSSVALAKEASIYVKELSELDVQEDDRGERYLDVSKSGLFTDQNEISEAKSRHELYQEFPCLKNRLVVFDHYEPLWVGILSFFQKPTGKRVFLVGTPGIGKSIMRNFHAHLILKNAKEKKEKCMVVMAKGGILQHVRLFVNSDGATKATVSEENLNHAAVKAMGYTPGQDFFCLADISNGDATYVFTEGGLVLYSSPSQKLANSQLLKQQSCCIGCPLPAKQALLCYASQSMIEQYEKFGPIPRIIWGMANTNRHESRLRESLKPLDEFLGVAQQRNYLKGPHRFFYMDVVIKDGQPQYNLDDTPPELIYAPRYVMKIVAEFVVKELLSPSVQNQFGMQHKAIDGILFEEVCLYLIAKHPQTILFETRNLGHRSQPLRGHLHKNVLKVEKVERQDVEDVVGVINPEASIGTKLLVPQASNYPGLDAALVMSGDNDPKHKRKKRKKDDHGVTTVLLQMTRSLNHPVSDDGINKFVAIERKMAVHGVASRNCVLFLVPDVNFESFQRQKASTKERQRDLNDVLQLVGSIKIRGQSN